MKLKVLTPDKLILDQEVDSVTLPGTEGQMTILPHHAAMVALLQKGEMYCGKGESPSHKQTIGEGFVEVLKDQVLVISKAAPVSEEDPSRR